MTVHLPIRQKPSQRSEYSASGYTEHFIVPLIKQNIEEVFQKYLSPVYSNARVLDAGCGRQPFRKMLESAGYSYKALDAQQNLDETVDIVLPVDHRDIVRTIPSNEFDLIFCTEVMEHVAEWDQAFLNFHHLLAPGGKLFITCPHFYHLHEEPHDFWRPTSHALKYFGDKYGFNTVYLKQAGDAWDVLGTLLGSFSIRPKTGQLHVRIIHIITAGVRRIAFWLLRKGFLQKYLVVGGYIYHCNIALFIKET
jgi:SAM-dependent methyltransferase